MKKAYRLTMDYEEFNFEDLKNEYEKNQTVTWYIKERYKKILKDYKNYCEKEECMDAYIYCSNMPDKLNRFVFKGVIKNVTTELDDEHDKDYEEYDCKIVIEQVQAFDEKDATILAIRNGNGIKFSPQSSCGELDSSVLKILTKIKPKENLQSFLDNFVYCDCELKDFEVGTLKHGSFTKKNKLKYVELHHLIFRSFGTEDDELYNILDKTKDNYVQLCSTCHRAIHYGELSLRERMLNKLLDSKKDKLKKIYIECLNHDKFIEKTKKYNAKDFEDFMYKIYEIRDNKKEE